MQTWAGVFMYMFLGYVFFHLVVGEIAHLIKAVRSGRESPPREDDDSEPGPCVVNYPLCNPRVLHGTVRPAAVFSNSSEFDVECQRSNEESHASGSSTHPFRIPVRRVNSGEQRSVVLITYKICDIVLYCLMGYFHTFTTCWCACIDCLNVLILKYITFLELLVTQILAYPAVVFLCPTVVLCLTNVCLIVRHLVSQ
jgi:hypothetical protein